MYNKLEKPMNNCGLNKMNQVMYTSELFYKIYGSYKKERDSNNHKALNFTHWLEINNIRVEPTDLNNVYSSTCVTSDNPEDLTSFLLKYA